MILDLLLFKFFSLQIKKKILNWIVCRYRGNSCILKVFGEQYLRVAQIEKNKYNDFQAFMFIFSLGSLFSGGTISIGEEKVTY